MGRVRGYYSDLWPVGRALGANEGHAIIGPDFAREEKPVPMTTHDMTPSAWDDFVAHHPRAHLLQTHAWGQLKAAFGWKPLPVAIRDCEGRICSEFVMCYPPGIPILAPGERITKEILNYIEYAKAKGCSMTGPEDPEILHLNVLA